MATISTHTLNSVDGSHAANVRLSIFVVGKDGQRETVLTGATDEGGRFVRELPEAEIDTQADYPETVVASALWHFEPTLQAAIAAVKDGSFEAANYGVYSYMTEGGSSLAPLGAFEGKVSEEVMELVREREAAIEAGEFEVEVDDSEPVSG